MTYQAFARARRLAGAHHRIRAGAKLDDVINSSGYDSHSGFRDAFSRLFGNPPNRARNRDCITIAWMPTPLGPMIAGANDNALCFLEFSDRRAIESQCDSLRKRFDAAVSPGQNTLLENLGHELDTYFAGTLRQFTIPIAFPGSPFQERVWNQLLAIPYGETRSYEDIAQALGDRNAVRAVGRANGLNRIAIVIPCHRVIKKDGKLGGYGGGLRRKEFLLALERGESPANHAQLPLNFD